MAVFAIAWVAWVITGSGLVDRADKPIGGDFVAFWSASRVALRGDPQAVYDIERLHIAEEEAIHANTDRVAWLYPPTFLAIVGALSLLPYLAALLAWLAATLGLVMFALRRYWSERRIVWLSLAFPGVMQNAIQGQTGFFSAGLLAVGLMGLEKRPVLAGAALGLMTYKPHLAPVVFLALIAGRRWHALAGAAGSAIALAGLSLAVFGWGPWNAFVDNFDVTRRLLFDGLLPVNKLTTVTGAALIMGAPLLEVYAAQVATSLAASAAVVWVWRRRSVKPALRNAAVCVGLLLATPYAFDYDLVILGLALLWLGVECQATGWLNGEREILTFGWLSPLLAPLMATAGVPSEPLILAAMFWLVVRRVLVSTPGAASLPHFDKASAFAA